jgi:hypothetical protein
MEEGVSVKGGIRKEGRSWRGAFEGKLAMIFLENSEYFREPRGAVRLVGSD